MSRTSAERCVELPWDSEFFGFKIGRVEGDTLTEALVDQIERWVEANGIICLYLLARSDDPTTTRLAENNDYRLVDVRMTFSRKTVRPIEENRVGSPTIRQARADDLPYLRSIAASSYQDSRFFYDSRFPRHLSRSLYEFWITTSLEGYAQAVFVAAIDDRPVGYVSCHLPNSERGGSIGLVGVAAEARGRGVGGTLVNAAVDWFSQCQVDEIRVVTQGRNVPAQRLYQRCGFVTDSVQLWYHKWYADAELSHD